MGLLMLNVSASRPSSGAVLQWGLRTTFENLILTEIAYNKAYWLSRAFKFRGEKIRKNLNRHARARVQDVKFGRLWSVLYAQSRNSLACAWFPRLTLSTTVSWKCCKPQALKCLTVGMFLLPVVMSERCWFARFLMQLEVSPTNCCLHFTQVIT